MSDVDQVLARVESDFDFYLAVRANPGDALAGFDLSSDERRAFAEHGEPLWRVVLTHTASGPSAAPDGGLPPPPPPFVVHHSIPTKREPWREGRETLAALRVDPAVQAALRSIAGADSPPSVLAAVTQLMERIG